MITQGQKEQLDSFMEQFSDQFKDTDIGLIIVDKELFDEYKLRGCMLLALKGKPAPWVIDAIMDMNLHIEEEP